MKGFKIALRKFVCCLSLVLIVAGICVGNASAQTKPIIMTWGENVPSWNEALGVDAMREACSIYPTQCEPYLDNLANLSGAKTYYVSMPFDPSTSVSWAKEYSTLSLSHKMMVEIGFDDFVNKIENDQIAGTLPNPAAFVSDVIAATKSANPNLAFGVTIYEDSLTHAVLTNAVLPAALRAEIKYVHLFVHYRENAPNYASYVATAKSIFPNARIIAGAYSYDRMDYLPCAYKGTVHCTWSQEQSLYKELLQIQANLLKQGTVYGLEFFFGYFGDPQDWPTWTSSTRICEPARLPTCYEDTTVLQNITLDVLRATFQGSVSLSLGGIAFGSEVVDHWSSPTTVTMKNAGTGPLAITSIGVGGLNSTDFPLTKNCPATLASGASCTMTVYFKPLATDAGDNVHVELRTTGDETLLHLIDPERLWNKRASARRTIAVSVALPVGATVTNVELTSPGAGPWNSVGGSPTKLSYKVEDQRVSFRIPLAGYAMVVIASRAGAAVAER